MSINSRGAVCVYLLFGIIWAILYNFVNTVSADTFKGFKAPAENVPKIDFVYFSFVTLTTFGYGDISPVWPFTRALAYLEAVVDQFSSAVLIAGLVSINLADRQASENTDTES